VKVVIGGGTGLLGAALAHSLRLDGHDVTIVTRHPRTRDHVAWTDAQAFNSADAIVNLAGESLADGRWTASRKASIVESRIASTRTIVRAIAASKRPPAVLLNASAVGIYGTHRTERLTEESSVGTDFLASVCTAWEAAALAATPLTRVVLLRSGMVLDRNAGALPKLARPFRLFVGGTVGSGNQCWSWIHIDDWVRVARWAIETTAIDGPLNATAPAAVTSREFAGALGRALHRPAVVPAPAFALRLLFGEMAEATILHGQRVLPAKATRHGFHFNYPTLESALRQLYR
jgi:uncharacterized protein (TIGR01777 family)